MTNSEAGTTFYDLLGPADAAFGYLATLLALRKNLSRGFFFFLVSSHRIAIVIVVGIIVITNNITVMPSRYRASQATTECLPAC